MENADGSKVTAGFEMCIESELEENGRKRKFGREWIVRGLGERERAERKRAESVSVEREWAVTQYGQPCNYV